MREYADEKKKESDELVPNATRKKYPPKEKNRSE